MALREGIADPARSILANGSAQAGVADVNFQPLSRITGGPTASEKSRDAYHIQGVQPRLT